MLSGGRSINSGAVHEREVSPPLQQRHLVLVVLLRHHEGGLSLQQLMVVLVHVAGGRRHHLLMLRRRRLVVKHGVEGPHVRVPVVREQLGAGGSGVVVVVHVLWGGGGGFPVVFPLQDAVDREGHRRRSALAVTARLRVLAARRADTGGRCRAHGRRCGGARGGDGPVRVGSGRLPREPLSAPPEDSVSERVLAVGVDRPVVVFAPGSRGVAEDLLEALVQREVVTHRVTPAGVGAAEERELLHEVLVDLGQRELSCEGGNVAV